MTTSSTTIDTSQAILVSLGFTLPRQSVQLPTEAAKIEADANATKGTVKASLFYFQQTINGKVDDALRELKSYHGEWRAQHARLTRTWDGNTRLLPAVLVNQYMEMTAKYEAGHPEQIEKFLDAYPTWRDSAPQRMGALYPKSNFPTASEVMTAITHTLYYAPLPAAEQLKKIAIIAPDTAKLMEESTNAAVAKAVAEAKAQTWKDVMEPIQHIVDTLSKDKAKIYDSLLGNVLDIVALVPAFNLDNDPQLAEVAAKAQEELSKVSTEDLRKSAEVRAATLNTAKNLIDTFQPFARKFGA